MTASGLLATTSIVAVLAVGCGAAEPPEGTCVGKCDELADTDSDLRALLASHGVEALERPSTPSPALIELGQALFFDKELSGNRDIACATCHHPLTMTTDQLSLPIGVGGHGLGPDREIGPGKGRIPRNSPEVYNRGSELWTTMFWDNRLALVDGELESPAGDALPSRLRTVLEAQAMFPPTSAAEMRGAPGDLDVFGSPNEIATLADDDFDGIWTALATRLQSIDGYVQLFQHAFPGLAPEEIGFEHAAIAIAAFESDAFTFTDSDFDRYLRGDDDALSGDAKRGAMLFYGKAGCGNCHAGPLLTDQRLHNICAPQIGPGREPFAPDDLGGFAVTGKEADRFAFRTPSLRNVVLTGPWTHAGAFTDLEAAVRHHLDVQGSVMSYQTSQLEPELRDTVRDDPELLASMLETIDPAVAQKVELADDEVDALMSFLLAVTDFSAADLAHLVPTSVPSGLPVFD